MNKILIISAVATLAFTSCASLGKYKHQETLSSTLYGNAELSDSASNIANFAWKDFFKDAKLQAYIDTAIKYNKDLLIAQEHIKQAEAELTGAKLAFVPTLGLTPGFTADFRGDKFSGKSYNYNLNASSSWQLNFFRLANDVKAGKASVSQANDYRQAVLSKLIANVASAYYTLMMLDSQYETAIKMEETWKESVETVKALKEAGLADQVAVSQYEANLDKIKISVINIKNDRQICENSICILLGSEIGQNIERNTLKDQVMYEKLSIGIPVQMLTLRPDVRAAERGMELAYYAKRGAILNYFPALSLNGSIGLVNPLTGAISPMELLAEAGAGLVAPILNAGKNRAALEFARSRQAETKLAFEQTILAAGKEVNDALNEFNARKQMAVNYKSRVDALDKAREDTEYLMRNSLDKTYLDVLFANTNFFDAKLAMIENEAGRLLAAVKLYSALGGGAL